MPENTHSDNTVMITMTRCPLHYTQLQRAAHKMAAVKKNGNTMPNEAKSKNQTTHDLERDDA